MTRNTARRVSSSTTIQCALALETGPVRGDARRLSVVWSERAGCVCLTAGGRGERVKRIEPAPQGHIHQTPQPSWCMIPRAQTQKTRAFRRRFDGMLEFVRRVRGLVAYHSLKLTHNVHVYVCSCGMHSRATLHFFIPYTTTREVSVCRSDRANRVAEESTSPQWGRSRACVQGPSPELMAHLGPRI